MFVKQIRYNLNNRQFFSYSYNNYMHAVRLHYSNEHISYVYELLKMRWYWHFEINGVNMFLSLRFTCTERYRTFYSSPSVQNVRLRARVYYDQTMHVELPPPQLYPIESGSICKISSLLITNCNPNQTICDRTVSWKTQFLFRGVNILLTYNV